VTGIVVLEAISLGYRTRERWLFKKLNFNLSSGQCLQVIGHNGAGKSTLIKILTTLIAPSKGLVKWQNQNLTPDLPKFTGSMAYLGHKLAVSLELTPLEHLQGLLTAIHDLPWDLLAEIGLSPYAHKPARYLSAGQQQRLALAGLLQADKKLWLLDEPLASMDTKGIQWFEAKLNQHLQNGGMAVVASHTPLNIKIPAIDLPLGQN